MSLNGLVVCADDLHREKRLLPSIRKYDATVFRSPWGARTVKDALANTGDMPDYAVLSLKGMPSSAADQDREFNELRQGLPAVPVVVELADDKPARAFDLLKLGAIDVRSGQLSRVDKLCHSIGNAYGQRKGPYQPLLKPECDAEGRWAFMSMTFAKKDENTNAFVLAICPAVAALGLSPRLALQRADDYMPDDARLDLRERVHDLITRRQIVVALLSPPDDETPPEPDCMYEIGYAIAAKKKVLVLWRENNRQQVPVMCPPNLRVEYSSRTELALSLFFGLGGTHDLLQRTWRP